MSSHRYLGFDPTIENQKTRTDFGLPEDKFIFANLNNFGKISPQMFDRWMKIMSRVPNSVILLRPPVPGRKYVTERAIEKGIDGSRILFAEYTETHREHLERASLLDLHLDCVPYGSHVTALDILWSGVPHITILNDLKMPSRVSASLLSALEMPELIVDSWEEYEELAVRLATNKKNYSQIKNKLIRNRMTAPAFDGKLTIQHIEKAYLKMWDDYVRGKPPTDIIMKKKENDSNKKIEHDEF